MSKPSRKNAPKDETSNLDYKMLSPKPTAAIVANLYNAPIKTIVTQQKQVQAPQSEGQIQAHWSQIEDFADSIAQNILMMAESINETVEMVKQVGCDHLKEFGAVVEKTNSDFSRFMEDFQAIRRSHATKTGYVTDPDDHALYLQLHERYTQFYSLFTGVMHHTQVSFTEYALEAKDRLVAQEAAQAAAQTTSPETPSETKDAQ